MSLTFIGLGLFDKEDISIKGLTAVKAADIVYLENYTAILGCSKEELETFYGKKILLADRTTVESDKNNQILEHAKKQQVALLIVGDVFSATTHTDLFMRAQTLGIKTDVIHNASIMTAIGATGLQLYKFGKTTSMTFFEDNWKPMNVYDTIKANKAADLHTLILLDIKVAEPSKENLKLGKIIALPPRFMTVNKAIEQLFWIESQRKEHVFTMDTFCVGAARIGSKDAIIKAGNAEDLIQENFGEPMHCLIVPSKLHFIEEEFLSLHR